MIARLIVFVSAAIYLFFVGDWPLAVLSLAGLIPGLLGLVASVVFALALFATGHYIVGVVVAAMVVAVFVISNPHLRISSEQ